jgi:glycosyltransferase involved in cell wall biosynthesis
VTTHDRAGRTRVAFVLPSFSGGGAERVVVQIAAGLDRARFAPSLIVLDGAGPWRDLVPGDVPVTDLARPRLSRALLPLRRALAAARPDAVLSTLGHLNLAVLALAPNARLYVREANTPHRQGSGAVSRALYRRAYRRLYPRAAGVIVPARYLAAELARDFGVPAGRLVHIPNPVDEAGLRLAAATPARRPGAGPRFVAVGRLAPQKGFDRLLDWFAVAPAEATLDILGDGPDRARLEAAAAGFAGRVRLPGFLPSAPWIAGADALLLPSRWEGLPNVALEALALGTPVIAMREAGGIGEIAADAAPGAVTLAADGGAFTAALRRVAADPPAAPRPSLLPPVYRREAAIARYAALLAGAT